MMKDFEKVAAVIESCKTPDQLRVATRMANLFFKKHADLSSYSVLMFVKGSMYDYLLSQNK